MSADANAQTRLPLAGVEGLGQPSAARLVPGAIIARLKGSSLALLSRLGVADLVAQTAWRRRRLLVLCYHGVSLDDEHRWNPHLYVSAGRLRRRFDILRRLGCQVLPLGDAVERLAEGTLPSRAVALTFDDGFYDFKARAYPLLQEYGYPATVYLPTQRCEHNLPIVRLLLSYALWRRRGAVLDGRDLPGLSGVYPLRTDADRHHVLDAIDGAMRAGRFGMRAKDAVVRQVIERLDLDYEQILDKRLLRLLDPEQVRGLVGPLVDFQLHTHRHYTPADAALFVQEIRDNRERVERMTGRRALHFCYPSGVYRPDYPAILRGEGIVSATTCDPGIASRQSDPLLLPRFIDTELVSDATFEGWVTGLACWLPRRQKGRAAPASAQ